MTYRTRYNATYLYPGVFMPEETSRDLPEPTFESAVKHGPDDPEYFTKDGWYAVRISTVKEKRYDAGDGDFVWMPEGKPRVEKVIVGTVISLHDPSIAGPEHRALRASIEYNSRPPFENLAVRTRVGNYQILSDWDRVVTA